MERGESSRQGADRGEPGAAWRSEEHRWLRLHCAGVLAARPTPDGLYVVGAGAHPIGGDALEVDLRVGDGVSLAVRSTGATVARAGPTGAPSLSRTTVELGDGAMLRWLVEPGIAAAGARHESRANVTLRASSRLLWREEVVLGRHGEDVPGSWRSYLDVRTGASPILVTDLAIGPAYPGSSTAIGIGAARATSMLVVVDPALSRRTITSSVVSGPTATGMLLPLDPSGVEVVAWGDDLGACRRILDELWPVVGDRADCPPDPVAVERSGGRGPE